MSKTISVRAQLLMIAIFLVIVALAVFVVPVGALGIVLQEEPPVSEVPAMVMAGLLFIVLAVAVSMGATQTTEIVKVIIALLSKFKLLSWLPVGGIWSWLYAGLVAIAGVFGFGIDIFTPIDIFADVDPVTVQYLSTMIVWLLSTFVYKVFYRKDGDDSPATLALMSG